VRGFALALITCRTPLNLTSCGRNRNRGDGRTLDGLCARASPGLAASPRKNVGLSSLNKRRESQPRGVDCLSPPTRCAAHPVGGEDFMLWRSFRFHSLLHFKQRTLPCGGTRANVPPTRPKQDRGH